ncbi:hypothetical protein ACFSMW_05645 [Virgibacillus halophilus]|uniref:DUF4190 domain-containing protein n=1 Tax=Tigheibacillus halophilus TaxID=361280 RepID=A0ABU5CBL7_9BACI|nr:hypothetical protein [Virgibacillus halophilus]
MDKNDHENHIEEKRADEADTVSSYNDRDEETAAEITADDFRTADVDDDDDIHVGGAAVGWIALALSVISFFWLPIILGAAGIIVGFVARGRDANTLGNIAIAAGAISVVLALFIRPFV